MGFLQRYTAERKEEAPEEFERTVQDNGCASGGTFLQDDYRSSCAFETIKAPAEVWCIPEDMEEGDQLMMDPCTKKISSSALCVPDGDFSGVQILIYVSK